jgi:hypothetical protein
VAAHSEHRFFNICFTVKKSNRMKNRVFVSLFVAMAILSLSQNTAAQEKWNITAGAGFPEFVNIGAAYQLNQAQVALSGILIPYVEGLIFSVSADYYAHFAGTSRFAERKPWYFRTNLNFNQTGSKDDYKQLMYLNLRVGRDLHISNKLGISIDIGPGIRLMKQPKNNDDFFDLAEPLIPSFGAHLFYRL